ncbi:MAG TPA: two-component sensor histidine kinase [Deltaproteobacteria bacterium]|nr:two-component sensor histidine kinase [Deltaproteobacteria bacterium]
MTPKVKEERVIKPFRLVKYFTFSSLGVIFLGSLALSLLNTHWAKAMQKDKSEEYAKVLIENLNHQIFTQFAIPIAIRYGKVQLRDEEQFERLDKVVRNTLYSFKVEMVTIYDLNNVVSYSFDNKLVGREGLGGKEFKAALKGKSASKLSQRGNILEIMLSAPKEIKMVSFAPVKAEVGISKRPGRTIGVFEIVQDLSEDYRTIFQFQIRVIITLTLVMGILFLVMLFVVKRGETIFEKRAEERLALKEQLSRAERLSSLGEMAAKISHEIRNPLGIIKSSTALLKKKMAAVDASNTILDVIVEETERLNNIITDFFNYAKPRSPNLTPCRVEEVIDKNLTFLAPQLDGQAYRIQTRYGNNLPEIVADTAMLYQAFLNILINAMQAMPDGGDVHIEVDSTGGKVHITFMDNGTGIPHDVLEKIWEPFFTTKDFGTGLGLGIVKNIVESHGGNVQMDNRPEGGARVSIELPVNQGA